MTEIAMHKLIEENLHNIVRDRLFEELYTYEREKPVGERGRVDFYLTATSRRTYMAEVKKAPWTHAKAYGAIGQLLWYAEEANFPVDVLLLITDGDPPPHMARVCDAFSLPIEVIVLEKSELFNFPTNE